MLILGMLSLLVIAGCGIGGGGKKDPISGVDVHVGFKGLTMDFLENAPPENVFESVITNNKPILSIFPVSLNIKNKGAFDIKDGVIVFGFEKAYVDYQETPKYVVEYVGGGDVDQVEIFKEGIQFDIEGKSITSPIGDEDFITVNAVAKQVGPQSEMHTSTIFATACYPYNTEFGTSVCIDTDIIGDFKGRKACDVKEVFFTEGQGGSNRHN